MPASLLSAPALLSQRIQNRGLGSGTAEPERLLLRKGNA